MLPAEVYSYFSIVLLGGLVMRKWLINEPVFFTSKSFISRVIIGVTPFRVLITLLITYLLSPRGYAMRVTVATCCSPDNPNY